MKPTVRVVTYNIFHRLNRWEKRLPLIVTELDKLNPDIICLQEVVLPRNTADEIANRLKRKYYVNIISRHDDKVTPDTLALAILSKQKPLEVSKLFLGSSEQRIAMRATFKKNLQEFDVVNTHLYWKPYHPLHKTIRLGQVKRLLSWAKSDREVIIAGDMNATPGSNAMHQFYRQGFHSAFKKFNGREPDWTCANPVPDPERTVRERIALVAYNLFKKYRFGVWRDVLDYVLVGERWKITKVDTFGKQPAADDPDLYASDHLGIYADLRLPLWRKKR